MFLVRLVCISRPPFAYYSRQSKNVRGPTHLLRALLSIRFQFLLFLLQLLDLQFGIAIFFEKIVVFGLEIRDFLAAGSESFSLFGNAGFHLLDGFLKWRKGPKTLV